MARLSEPISAEWSRSRLESVIPSKQARARPALRHLDVVLVDRRQPLELDPLLGHHQRRRQLGDRGDGPLLVGVLARTPRAPPRRSPAPPAPGRWGARRAWRPPAARARRRACVASALPGERRARRAAPPGGDQTQRRGSSAGRWKRPITSTFIEDRAARASSPPVSGPELPLRPAVPVPEPQLGHHRHGRRHQHQRDRRAPHAEPAVQPPEQEAVDELDVHPVDQQRGLAEEAHQREPAAWGRSASPDTPPAPAARSAPAGRRTSPAPSAAPGPTGSG